MGKKGKMQKKNKNNKKKRKKKSSAVAGGRTPHMHRRAGILTRPRKKQLLTPDTLQAQHRGQTPHSAHAPNAIAVGALREPESSRP